MFLSRAERVSVIALLGFGGISAVAGMIGLFTDTLQMPEGTLAGSPFPDYTIPALILGVIVGGSQFAALAALLRHQDWAVHGAAMAGCIMMGWIVGEVFLLGSDPGMMRNLQVLYFVNGLLEVALAVALYRIPQHAT